MDSLAPLLPRDAVLAEKRRRLAERCKGSLQCFVETFWPVVEPATKFEPNWHIEDICRHLEAVRPYKVIQQLIINMPPRFMKSLLVSVFWPCWVWLHFPAMRFLFASYAASLSERDGGKRLAILQSPLWTELFGPMRFRKATSTKTENTDTGYFLSTSVGGATTGEGGDVIVVDDPHNALEAFSEVEREKVKRWWDNTMSTRTNTPKEVSRVLVMQRLHEDDLTGHLLKKGGWDHYVVRQEFEIEKFEERPRTRLGSMDPRTEEGQLLWIERVGDKEVLQYHRDLGDYGFAGQQQQRPMPLSGNMFKKPWWKYWKALPALEYIVISVDAAFKSTSASSYVAIEAWGKRGVERYALDVICEHLSFVETLEQLRRFYTRIKEVGKWNGLRPGQEVRAIIIEDKANGPAIINTLQSEIPGIIAWNPEGSKESRAAAMSPKVQAGNYYLPAGADALLSEGATHTIGAADWIEAFKQQCAAFPSSGTHNDMVDAMSQTYWWICEHEASTPLVGAPVVGVRRSPVDIDSRYGDDEEDE